LSQAEQLLQLSKLVGEAASLQPDLPARRYVRPEDNPINPGELYPSYGTDSGLLAKNGKTLPSYNFGGNAGQLLGSFIGGGRGQGSGAGNLGSTIGGVAGSLIPGVGTILGSAVGGLIGGVIGG